ncbi:TPA: two pore domain potassium channel family protein [Legionella pneumophila]|nr:two pore domain potassium channel family protein [Legionella pneumophila]HAU0282331.1 two pore domain potassium channel family protein [Legionella pneumophila]HBD9320253.1 two pore domain potassium channel family protein [Legionella pneumophila]HBD9332960.1 two pore domain potassium channel family protein [Legionella pneumophila]
MSLRREIAESLDPALRISPGLSVLNKAITIIIILSLLLAIIETERSIYQGHEWLFLSSEWIFTIVFAIEYVARVWVSIENPKYSNRLVYMLTPAAILDLLTVLLILLTTLGTEGFILRLARLLRVLRIAKLGRYTVAMQNIGHAIYSRRFELIISFAIGVFALILSSSILYIVEGGVQPDYFGSIPRAMWWSIATLTTVGYGDVYPITPLGKLFGAITAITGIGLIAMPTGILAASFSDAIQNIRKNHQEEE